MPERQTFLPKAEVLTLEELHALTGNGLRVKFQEIEPPRTGKRGRPASRWTLQFQPGSKLLTRKAVKSAPKTLK